MTSARQPLPCLLMLYGSLMRSVGTQQQALGAARDLRYLGPCLAPGRLLDLGAYPGLIMVPGRVRGELYRVLRRGVFEGLDAFEDYDPKSPQDSLYLRRSIKLLRPERRAWTYVYAGTADAAVVVKGGDWRQHLRRRAGPGGTSIAPGGMHR